MRIDVAADVVPPASVFSGSGKRSRRARRLVSNRNEDSDSDDTRRSDTALDEAVASLFVVAVVAVVAAVAAVAVVEVTVGATALGDASTAAEPDVLSLATSTGEIGCTGALLVAIANAGGVVISTVVAVDVATFAVVATVDVVAGDVGEPVRSNSTTFGALWWLVGDGSVGETGRDVRRCADLCDVDACSPVVVGIVVVVVVFDGLVLRCRSS
jgi:hypothetical protein